MRVLVLGAGAIGGYFGCRLIEAGVDVAFLVRPARAARLSAEGLRVYSARGDFSGAVRAITEVDGHYDLVILSCKAYDLDAAIDAIRPAVGPDTIVLPLLNGVRQLETLEAAFGSARVAGGVAHISVTLEGDGSIRQFGSLEKLTFGSRDASRPLPAGIEALLRAIGPQVVRSDNILGAMWDKFAFIATLAGATCLMRSAVGEIVATEEGADLIRRLHAECLDVAARSGHASGDAAIAAARDILVAQRSPLKASMLRDLERGAKTECEHILGDLRARAADFGLDTPLLSAALAHLRVYEAARTASHGG